MPATVETADSPTATRKDSAFFEMDNMTAMERIRSSAERTRTESMDSGVDVQTRPRSSLALPNLPIRRSGSLQSGSLTRPKTESNLVFGNIGEQTHLLLRKMAILEQKLTSMESQLKNEQVQRLNLEAKVVKLEEDNEKLKDRKAKAGQQLQEFSEKFFTMTDAAIKVSPVASPFPSLNYLHIRSRADSISSSSSYPSSRLSAISL